MKSLTVHSVFTFYYAIFNLICTLWTVNDVTEKASLKDPEWSLTAYGPLKFQFTAFKGSFSVTSLTVHSTVFTFYDAIFNLICTLWTVNDVTEKTPLKVVFKIFGPLNLQSFPVTSLTIHSTVFTWV